MNYALRQILYVIFLILHLLFVASCQTNHQKKDDKKQEQYAVELGKALFFDTQLSSNEKVSCATCHQPQKAFTDGQSLSNLGVSGKTLLRNSPTLINVKFVPELFWDGGAKNLESQAVAPLTHQDEMNQDLRKLVLKLSQNSQYNQQFRQAFQTDSLTTSLILKALAAYQRTITPQKTKFDAWFYETDSLLGFPNPHKQQLSSLELKGYQLFLLHCNSCHTLPLLTNHNFYHNGLDSIFTDESSEQVKLGRFRVTKKAEDIGKFKTPTLRNIILTAPYMHDGRFKNLDEVLEHYAKLRYASLQKLIYTDKKLQNLHLSSRDLEAIKAFLQIL
jgi:cytochrome c peroxidase